MERIKTGVRFIGLGILEILMSVLRCIAGLFNKAVRKYKRRRLRRATEYVRRYGYELSLNSRVLLAGRAYYVFSYEYAEDIENRREVRLNLIGVPQYKEIIRRVK